VWYPGLTAISRLESEYYNTYKQLFEFEMDYTLEDITPETFPPGIRVVFIF
jgi:hypothetical protein